MSFLGAARPAGKYRPLKLAVVTLATAFALSLASSCQLIPMGGSSPTQGLQGRITWPKDGDLWVYDLATKQQQKITNLPAGAAVTGATWSPDGQRLVYAQFWRRPNERSSGSDLFVANADGSNPQLFAEPDAPNTVLEAPQWVSSRVYYTTRQVLNGREATTIVRRAQDGDPEQLGQGGYSPALSADESTLVYVRPTRAGQALVKKMIGQPGDGCELLSDRVFQYLSLPRISPDGKRLAFGGSGEPAMQPSACGGDPRVKPTGAGRPQLLELASLLGPSVAYAHGLPADIWSLDLDGSNLTRIAEIKDDDPSVAWSPDGSRLAIFGVAALWVVDGKGGATQKLVDQGGYGGLAWAK